MQVLIKTPTDSTFAVVIHHNETVKELKRVIRDIDKAYTRPFSLKYGTKPLHDHSQLASYHLKDGATLYLAYEEEKTIYSPNNRRPSKVNPLHYKSMITRSALKENIEQLQNEFTQSIANSFPKAENSEISIRHPINSIQCNDEHHVVLLGTDTGNIIHYDLIKKEVLLNFSRTKDHGISRMVVAGMTDIFVVGAPKGIYLYKGPERIQIVQTLSPETIFEVTKGGEYVFYKKGERMIEKYSVVDLKKESLFAYPGPIKAIALSNKEDKLVIGGFETEIRIFSTINGSLLKVLPNSKQGSATSLKMTSDDKHLITVSSKRYIKMYDLETSDCHMFRHTHSSDVTSIVLSPDNKVMFSGSQDGSLTIYDLEKMAIIHYFNNYQEGGIRALQMTNNGNRLISGGNAGNIKIYDIESTDEIVRVPTEYESINWLTSCFTHGHMIAACKDGSIRMVNNATGELERSIENIGAGQAYIVDNRSNEQSLIAGAFEDKSIRVFDYLTGEEYTKITAAHIEQITGLVFSRDSKVLISSSMDKSLKVWDTFSSGSGPIYVDVNSHTDAISCMRLSSSGKYLVTATWGRTISVFEFSQIYRKNKRDVELKRVHMFKDAHDGHITSLAISSDNKYIVSSGSDLAIKLFDFERRNFLCAFYNCHKSIPNSVNLMQENQYIVSIDEGGQVNYFSIAARKQVYSETIPNAGKIMTAAITKTSKQIMTGSANGKLSIINNVLIPSVIKVTCGSIPVSSPLGFCLLEHFIFHAVSSRKRIDLISKYSNLYIHPNEWNFLHIVAIFTPQIELIDACIKEKIPFTKDRYGYTPLHYLLQNNQNDVTAVNHLLAKFGDLIQDERDLYPAVSTLSNQLQDIIKYGSFQAANFLEYAMMTPQQFAKNSITCFGSLKKGKSRYVVADSTVFTPEIKEDLVGPEGDQMLTVKVIGFKFNYGPSSKDMLRLILFLNDINNEQIYKSKTINTIIDYLWSRNRRVFYLPTVIYSIAMIVLSSYCAQDMSKRSFGHEIALLVIGSLSFVYELWLLIVESSLYLTDLWNLIDLVVNSLLIASSITTWTLGPDSPSAGKLLTATLFFGYLRWFSYFRLIDQTRKLSKMIGEVLKDMTSFLVVLAFVTIGFGFIFLQLRPESTLSDQLLYTYNLIYTNYDDPPMGSEIPYFVIFTIFVSVTMLNMLIAIMNETYDRVQGSRHYYENKTKVNLIIEAITAKRFLMKVTLGIRKSAAWRKIKSFYFMGKIRSIPDLSFEKDFESREGFLYFVEETKKQEYEQIVSSNNTNREGKRKDDDDDVATEAFQNVLREELKLLKQDFEAAEGERSSNMEAVKRGKEALNYRMGRLEDKMESFDDKMERILKLLGNQPGRSEQPDFDDSQERVSRTPTKQNGPRLNNFIG